MKRFILLACLLQVVLVSDLTVSSVQAQSYPNRPIQLIVPAVPGATSDITGRLLAEEMERILGGRVVVINKPGGSMTLGTDTVARSRKDGYTLLRPISSYCPCQDHKS